jgi:hypothetical protein
MKPATLGYVGARPRPRRNPRHPHKKRVRAPEAANPRRARDVPNSLGAAGATKEGARCLAIQRWPHVADCLFALKRHHNRAEAALLGAYFLERRPLAARAAA